MSDPQAPLQVTPPGPHPRSREPFLRRLSPVAFALFALAAIFILYQVVGGVITLVIARGEITPDNVGLVRWATFFGQILFILIPTILFARWRHGRVVQFLRIRVPEIRELVVTMIAVFALQQVLQTYMILQESIPLPSELQKFVDLLKKMIEETYRVLVLAHSPLEFLVVLLIVALVPAISEELLFRGLVQRNLEDAVGGMRGAILAGIIFGAYHLNPFGIVPLVALGVYFGFIVYRSENITLAVSAHFFNNFVACAAVYLQLDENFVVIDPSARPTGSLIAVNFMIFALVFVLSTLYFIHITGRDDQREEPY
ncbi:MAG: CPBP family intramembrane glutamic endopeptidase [Bacteroidota bacterium]